MEQHFLRSPLRLYSELDVDNNNQLYHPALSQATMDKRLQLQLWGAAATAAAVAAAASQHQQQPMHMSSSPSSPTTITSPRTTSAPTGPPTTPAELHALLAAAAASSGGHNGHRPGGLPHLPPHLWSQWPPMHGPPHHHLHALAAGAADLRLPRPIFPMHQRYSPYLIPPKPNSALSSSTTPPSVQIPSAGPSPTPDSTPSPRE